MASSSKQAASRKMVEVPDWRKLLKAPSNHSLEYFPPQILNGKPLVAPLDEIFAEGESKGLSAWARSMAYSEHATDC
ncbi:hypothetical protein DITRI_Ditri06bG0087300 [Diplodiscus trichospermus]